MGMHPTVGTGGDHLEVPSEDLTPHDTPPGKFGGAGGRNAAQAKLTCLLTGSGTESLKIVGFFHSLFLFWGDAGDLCASSLP